jgi:hypothetical protein
MKIDFDVPSNSCVYVNAAFIILESSMYMLLYKLNCSDRGGL